jgi:uncharacterized protein
MNDMPRSTGNAEVLEERITIAGADVNLEGRLAPGGGPGGVVITHPHPMYGGTMDNNVVWTAARAFQARDWTTLRFNFRGVGLSSGEYGDGVSEMADVQAALAYLESRQVKSRYVVGYSFGAAVAGRALVQGASAAGIVMIAPPIAFMDMAFLPKVPRLRLIVLGDRDEFCPLPQLEEMFAGRPEDRRPEIKVVSDSSHFFAGREKPLYQILLEYPLD